MKTAFTLIELIFAIVIIGVLAAVATVKLSATRDDAKAVKAKRNLAVCLGDISSYYTATEKETSGTQDNASDFTKSCKDVARDNCFTIKLDSINDGNVTVIDNSSNTSLWCKASQEYSHKENLSAPNPGLIHSFGGTKIKTDN